MRTDDLDLDSIPWIFDYETTAIHDSDKPFSPYRHHYQTRDSFQSYLEDQKNDLFDTSYDEYTLRFPVFAPIPDLDEDEF